MGYTGGVNLYGYTGNNPVNFVDPEGLMGGPGKGEPIKGWTPPLATVPVPRPGWHSGLPGHARWPDYYAVTISGASVFAPAIQIEVDRYGDMYFGYGGSFSTKGTSVSLVERVLNQSTAPCQDELIQWMQGDGVNVMIARYAEFGETWSINGSGNPESATEWGAGTPGVGLTDIITLPPIRWHSGVRRAHQ